MTVSILKTWGMFCLLSQYISLIDQCMQQSRMSWTVICVFWSGMEVETCESGCQNFTFLQQPHLTHHPVHLSHCISGCWGRAYMPKAENSHAWHRRSWLGPRRGIQTPFIAWRKLVSASQEPGKTFHVCVRARYTAAIRSIPREKNTWELDDQSLWSEIGVCHYAFIIVVEFGMLYFL